MGISLRTDAERLETHTGNLFIVISALQSKNLLNSNISFVHSQVVFHFGHSCKRGDNRRSAKCVGIYALL